MSDASLRAIDEALISLRRLWASPPRIVDDALGQVDMSTVWVVHTLRSHGGAATVSVLAEHMDVAHSTASRLVSRAERSGATRRAVDTDDQRSVVVQLTDAGRRLDDVAVRFRLGVLQLATDDFTDEEREQFASLLTRFARSISKGNP